MADDFTVRFELDVAAATQNANRLAQSLGGVVSALNSAQAPAQQVAQSLNAVSAASNQRTRQAANSTRATKQMSDAELGLAQGLYTQSQAYTDISKASQAAASNRSREMAQSRQYYADATRGAQAVAKGLESTLGPAEQMKYIPTTFGQIEESTRRLGTSLPTLRYALYDVAATFGVLGGALVGMNVALVGTAITWERAFANVIRTSGAAGPQIAALREQLVGLTRELPIAFGDIAEIASLGGQLGIAATDLDEFTSVVARLTATTDLSAEAAGTALGRFQALMGVPSSEFENLASAILNVGVNSVATETQIVSIATQISSMGRFAGLTAAETVGLAGALASVGAQPELSRGTITRVFVQMSRAIAQGGDRLDEFGRVSGVSGKQFANSFGKEGFGDVFLKFISGIKREGSSAVQTLNDLGITSVRDVPLLQRLALANETVVKSFVDAKTAYETGATLQEHYGIVAETTASKLKILGNAFAELMDVLGGSVLDAVKDGIEVLTSAIQNLSDFMSTGVGQAASVVVIVLTTLVGVLALAAAGVATLGATIAANVTVWQAFTGQVITFNGVMATTGAVLRTVMSLLGRIAGVVGVITLGAVLVGWIEDLGRTALEASGAEASLGDLEERLRGASKGYELFSSELGRHGNVFEQFEDIPIEDIREAIGVITNLDEIDPGKIKSPLDAGYVDDLKEFVSESDRIGGAVNVVRDNLNELDEALANLAKTDPVTALARIREFEEMFNLTPEETAAAFDAAFEALARAGVQAGVSAAEMELYAAAQREAEAAAEALAHRNETLAESFEISTDALEDLSKSYEKAMGSFGNIGDILKRAQEQNREWYESVAESTASSKDSWKDYYDGVWVSLGQFMSGLQEDMLAQAQFATNIATLMAMGYTSFAAAALETGADAAQVVADALAAGPDQLSTIEESYRQMARVGTQAWFEESSYFIQAAMDIGDKAGEEMIAAIASGDPKQIQDAIENWDIKIPFASDFTEVDESFRQHKAMWEEPITKTVWLDVRGGGADFGVSAWNYYADGGPIYGPGTSTSDSIPARLSNGEYVIRASAVRKYGTGLFDALNRGVAKFASGGQVGGGVSFPSSMVTEFGPQSMAAVRGLGGQGGNVTVVLDDVAIAQAAARGNEKLVGQGIR